MDTSAGVLIITTLFAAFVNGALGYGFSSLTVPIALLFYTSRVINPALVLIEIFINAYVLVINRQSIPEVWKRFYPIIISLLPGVAAGSYFLTSIQPSWAKFSTYAFLFPLILIQAAGLRRPLRSEKSIGLPVGIGLGFLYSVTTISGPPIGVLLNNQGLTKRNFRAGLALIRVVESVLTAIAYYHIGVFSRANFKIIAMIIPSMLVGIPLGGYCIRRIDAEAFRRICMSFDVLVVAFGLSRVLIELKIAQGALAYIPVILALLADSCFLFSFFSTQRHARDWNPAPTAPAQKNRLDGPFITKFRKA
jgi:uncharacterized membrane protein YfcA